MSNQRNFAKTALLFCDICPGVQCNTKQQLAQHCKGVKHKSQQQKLARKENVEPRKQEVAPTKIEPVTNEINLSKPPAARPNTRKRTLNDIQNTTLAAKVAKFENGKDVKESQQSEKEKRRLQGKVLPEKVYDRSGHADNAHGITYQRLFTLWILLQVLSSPLEFQLGAEVSSAGKWDDLYLYFQHQCIRLFFQLKHGKSNDSKFKLRNIIEGKDKINLKDMIKSIDNLVPRNLTTKIAAVFYTNKSIVIDIPADEVEIIYPSAQMLESLHLESIVNNPFGCFQIKVKNPAILEKLASETGLPVDKINENLDRILFIADQWGVEQLKAKIMDEIKTLICSEHTKQAYACIMQTVQDWMEEKKGSYFNRQNIISICKEAKVCPCMQSIKYNTVLY